MNDRHQLHVTTDQLKLALKSRLFIQVHRPLVAAATAKMSTGVPSGSSRATSGSNRRLQQTQNQVDEVVDIMRVNVDKVLERDQKLSELDDRADALQAGASQSATSPATLKRKYWWHHCKVMPS